MKILLVDDSKQHRESGVADLNELGHEVVALKNYSDVAKAITEHQFDAALLDLLMPSEPMTLGGEGLKHLGEPFAVGYPLAVYLATKSIHFIAVGTDTNHHNHPASAMMDWLSGEPVTMNGCLVMFMHSPMKQVGERVKDWAQVLRRLLATGQ
jgi:CheY-like chemotaxis protein